MGLPPIWLEAFLLIITDIPHDDSFHDQVPPYFQVPTTRFPTSRTPYFQVITSRLLLPGPNILVPVSWLLRPGLDFEFHLPVCVASTSMKRRGEKKKEKRKKGKKEKKEERSARSLCDPKFTRLPAAWSI